MRLPVVVILVSLGIVANAQTEKTFLTDGEIGLVLTQTERAMQQYKPLIDQQESEMGKSVADAVVHDREVVNALEMAVKGFRNKPQAFNGPLGFAFFEWIDDADGNAVLCANFASTQAALQMMAGNKDKAASLLHLAQSCLDVSTLIYTVSENAGALYKRSVEAWSQLVAQGTAAAEKCAETLKKGG